MTKTLLYSDGEIIKIMLAHGLVKVEGSVEDYLDTVMRWEDEIRAKLPGIPDGQLFRCQLLAGDDADCELATLIKDEATYEAIVATFLGAPTKI